MKNIKVTLKIEEELLEKAKRIVAKNEPTRYPDVNEIKYAAAAREAIIFYINQKENLK